LPLAEKVAARLIERKETIAVAEGSAGGLIAAALLSVPGASAYFVGGAVVYTGAARNALTDIGAEDMKGIRPASEPYAALLAKRMRERLNTTWGLAEAGAAGPSGNRYGDPAGHTCVAISGASDRAATLRTGSADRQANMRAFAARALELLAESIGVK
jgi:PncC family amidohydrolase